MSQYPEDSRQPVGFVPRTSLAAYAMMRKTGQDRSNQYRVYRFIGWAQDDPKYHGGISRANIKVAFCDLKDSFAPRIAELRRMGLIYRSHEKTNDAHSDCKNPMQVIANRTTKRVVPLDISRLPKEYVLLIRRGLGVPGDTSIGVHPHPLLNMTEVDIAVRSSLAARVALADMTILQIWHGGRRVCVPCRMPVDDPIIGTRQAELF